MCSAEGTAGSSHMDPVLVHGLGCAVGPKGVEDHGGLLVALVGGQPAVCDELRVRDAGRRDQHILEGKGKEGASKGGWVFFRSATQRSCAHCIVRCLNSFQLICEIFIAVVSPADAILDRAPSCRGRS